MRVETHFNNIIRSGHIEEMTFEQRLEEFRELAMWVGIWQFIPGLRNCQCKGPEKRLEYLRNNEKVSAAGMKSPSQGMETDKAKHVTREGQQVRKATHCVSLALPWVDRRPLQGFGRRHETLWPLCLE